MATLVTDPGKEILEKLGLPKSTFEFNLSFKVNELAVGSCKFYLHDVDKDELFNIITRKDEIKGERLKRRMDSE